MTRATILASAHGPLIRLALLEAGTLVEYTLFDPANPDGVGDLYEGRVTARAPAMGGVFVDLGPHTLIGFLPDSAGGKSASEGDWLRLRITRAAQGGKGPRLAAAPLAADPLAAAPLAADAQTPSTHKPGLIARGPGPLGALQTLHPTAPILADDYAIL
ncbi:MAG: hypothetical protein ACP5M1_08275, partial [Acidiphilium sp.]